MTKRIALSLMTIVAVLAIASGATVAYFTDQEVVSNSFAAGKLDVDLTGTGSNGTTISLGTEQTFQGGMQPGVWEGPYYVNVYNQGWGKSTIPAKYRWTATQTGGNSDMYDLINVKVEHGNCMTGGPSPKWTIYEGPISSMDIDSTNPPQGSVLAGGVLTPNMSHCWVFSYELDESADNSIQGIDTQFDVVLTATQTNNTGWTE